MQSLGFSFIQGSEKESEGNYKKKKITNSDLNKTRKKGGSSNNSISKKRLLKLVESMSNRMDDDDSDHEGTKHLEEMKKNLGKLLPPPMMQSRQEASSQNDENDEDENDEYYDDKNIQFQALSKQVHNGSSISSPQQSVEGFNTVVTHNGKVNSIMNTNSLGFQQYIPNSKNMSAAHDLVHGTKDELLEKLNYMIHLLEEQQDEKTGQVTEELILYCFLGVFVIFMVDSFARAGKYVR